MALTTLPLGLDERIFEPFQSRDPMTGRKVESDEVNVLANATKLAREEAASLIALERAVFADATRTEQARALSVSEAAAKSAQRVVARLDEARAKVLSVIEREEKLSAAPPPPITALDIAREAEIRAALKAMPEAERADTISNAFVQKKTGIIAAVLHGDGFLTGIGDAKMESLRHRYRETFHPGVYARTKRLREALDAYDRAGALFIGLAKSAAESPAARLAASNAQRAQEALAAHGAR